MPFRASYPSRTAPRRSPRQPVPRHDGFSPAQQRLFLTTLAATASVRAAAEAVGVSRTTAYNHRNDPRAVDFREGWAAALARATQVLVDTAFARAVDGVEEPVYHAGKQVGTRIRHDSLLLRMLIERRFGFAPATETIHRDGTSTTHETYAPKDFAARLDRIDPPPRANGDIPSTSSTSPVPESGAIAS